jgi:choline transport protein
LGGLLILASTDIPKLIPVRFTLSEKQLLTSWVLVAVLFTIAFSCALSLINIGSLIAFNQIISLGVCALLSSYIVSISCVTARRIRGEPLLSSRFSLGRWGLPINIASIAFLVLSLVISFFPPVAAPPLNTMNWSVVIYAGVLVIALIHYIFWARFTYVGPVEYVRKGD